MKWFANGFLSLSIRWKLQLSFFLVTMATIIINRWVGYGELKKVADLVKSQVNNPLLEKELDRHVSSYLTDAVWHSAIEFAVLFAIIALLAKLIVAPIMALCEASKSIEKGDLTHLVPNNSRDEIGILEHSFNSMISNLNDVIRNVDESGKQMANSAYQIAAMSHEIAEGSRAESERSSEVSHATEALQRTTEMVKQSADDATERAQKTDARTKEGLGHIRRNIEEMTETVARVNAASDQVHLLNDAAQKIFSIIEAIRTIAEQTNLLALNAAIEAARAGEQGRGFAVVADEVRSLASRTTKSTSEISEIIAKLNQQVQQVSDVMGDVVVKVSASQESATLAANVMDEIANDVGDTVRSNREISAVSDEQMLQFETLSERIAELFETFKASAAKVATTAGIGDDLHRKTEEISRLLRAYTYEVRATVVKSEHEQRRSPRMESALRVKIQAGDRNFEGLTGDISLTGLKLRTRALLSEGERIQLRIYVPYSDLVEYQNQEPIHIEGRAVWVNRQGDSCVTGIHFDTPKPFQIKALEECFRYFNKKSNYDAA